MLLCTLLAIPVEAAPHTLSKRAQARYEDVVTTKDGSRWRGRIVEKGDVYRIRLADNSEVVIPKEQVQSVTRELDPGLPHQGQWGLRVSGGVELGVKLANSNAGLRYGPVLELSLSRSFGGSVEPELLMVYSPMGEDQGQYTLQLGLGTRIYFQPERKAKPFAATQFILLGTDGDLGLRTGPGFQWDWSPNAGIGFVQGFELISQKEEVDGKSIVAVGMGYHMMAEMQLRF